MLQYEVAKKLFENLQERERQNVQSGFQDFFRLFLKCAMDYASVRSSWATMDQVSRNEDDKHRRIKHDAFISMLGAVSRNLGMEEIEKIMPDRKTKGDFACYIALFLALEQR